MKYGELNLGQIEAIVNKLGGMSGVERLLAGDLIVANNRNAASAEISLLTIDYGLSLEQMIAVGEYDWKNDDITSKHFPIKGQGIVQFERRYFHFDRDIFSEDAVKEIETADTENPWMPAQIEHLLANGKQFPEDQRKFPIIALGSVAKVFGYRRVSYLFRDGWRRYLHLSWWGSRWGRDYRFLAVRKVSAS